MCALMGAPKTTTYLMCALANKAGRDAADARFLPWALCGNADSCHVDLEAFRRGVSPINEARRGDRIFVVTLKDGVVLYRQ